MHTKVMGLSLDVSKERGEKRSYHRQQKTAVMFKYNVLQDKDPHRSLGSLDRILFLYKFKL